MGEEVKRLCLGPGRGEVAGPVGSLPSSVTEARAGAGPGDKELSHNESGFGVQRLCLRASGSRSAAWVERSTSPGALGAQSARASPSPGGSEVASAPCPQFLDLTARVPLGCESQGPRGTKPSGAERLARQEAPTPLAFRGPGQRG